PRLRRGLCVWLPLPARHPHGHVRPAACHSLPTDRPSLAGRLMNFVSADEALGAVQSGQRVYIHNGCSEPLDLVRALTRRGPELANVEVLHMATMGIAPYAAPEFEGHFRHNGLFLAANVRQAVQECRADYTPVFLSEIEGLFTSGAIPIDVCLL